MRTETMNIEPLMQDAKKRFGREESPWGMDWYAFPQMWGSTALGFGGIGGQAMTTAQTVVIGYGNRYEVYFGGRFAYEVINPNEKFFEDMRKWRMASLRDAKYSKDLK